MSSRICVALSAGMAALAALCAVAVAREATWMRHGGRARVERRRLVPGPATSLAAVDCVSAGTCYAVGNAGGRGAAVVTIHDGVPSRARVFGPAQPAPTGPDTSLSAIACASGSSCEAIGSDPSQAPIAVAIDGGHPGTIQTAGSARVELSSVSCAAPGSCLSVGDVGAGGFASHGYALAFASGQPGTPHVATHAVRFDSVACPSATMCEALAAPDVAHEDLYELAPDGYILRSPTPFGSFSPSAIACPSATTCLAVGDYVHHPPYRAGVISIANGVPGRPQPAPGIAGLSAISCATPDVCEAIGYTQTDPRRYRYRYLIVTIDHGVPGSPTFLPYSPSGMACPTATTCILTANEIRRPYRGFVVTIRLPRVRSGSPPPRRH